MKLTVVEAVNAYQALLTLGEGKLPMQLSINIAHNRRELEIVNKEYEKRNRELAEKNGKSGKDGRVTINPSKIKIFNDAAKKIGEEEITVDLNELVFDFDENYAIEPNILYHIQCMFKKDDQKPK